MNVEPRIARIPVVQKLLGGISKPKVYDLIKQGRLELLHIGVVAIASAVSTKDVPLPDVRLHVLAGGIVQLVPSVVRTAE